MEIEIVCHYDELVNPKKLKNHSKNRNHHPQEQIERFAQMLPYHKFRKPIEVSRRSGCIVAGHGRKLAALRIGMELVPVVYQDFDSDEAEYAYIQADNALALWAELDLSGINTDLADLGPDFDLDMLGIKDFKLDLNEEVEGHSDPDEVPEDVPTKAKLGDLFILGNHRLLCGDSTDMATVERLMNGEKADMVFTDPPYGVAIKNKNGSILGDQDLNVFNGCIPLLKKYSKEQSHFYIYFGVQFSRECIEEIQKYFKQTNILIQRITHENKPSPEGYFKSNYELCYFSNPTGKPFNHGHLDVSETTLKDSRYNGDGKAKTYPALIEIKATEHNLKSVHPTQKTIAICEFYQKISSNVNDSVLDLFGGSGSTLIACEKTNRKCFMMELDPHYIDVIIARWQKFTNKKALREDGILWDDMEAISGETSN